MPLTTGLPWLDPTRDSIGTAEGAWARKDERTARMGTLRSTLVTVLGVGVAVAGTAVLTTPAHATTRYYTAAQVAQHKSSSNCWTIVGTGVYNLTSYVNRHPGGSWNITSLCGRNGTRAFQQMHGSSSSANSMLSSLRIGTLRK